jgi:hypothetical protein
MVIAVFVKQIDQPILAKGRLAGKHRFHARHGIAGFHFLDRMRGVWNSVSFAAAVLTATRRTQVR